MCNRPPSPQATKTMTYSDYLETDYWKAVAAKVKARAGYRCQLCNSQHDLCAHHRTYDHRGKELDHLDDLTCLCRRCHEIFHGKQPASNHQIAPKIDDERSMTEWIGSMKYVKLTREMLMACRTEAGGFTNVTIAALGVKSTKEKWSRSLIGTRILEDNYKRALAGRLIFGKKLSKC